ncbi:MAG: metalloregulator ArsR/SmtB family transcription factor [Planctomycetota bacterium]
MDLGELAPRMAALGNATRLAAYRLLVRAGAPGLPVAAVQERLGVPASTLSHHLRALREVGLVAQERRGATRICRADFEVLRTTFAWLEAECCVDADASEDPHCCGTEDPQPGRRAAARATDR